MQAGGYGDQSCVELQVICRTAGGSGQRYPVLHSKLYVAPTEKLLGALGPDSYWCCSASSAAVGSVHSAYMFSGSAFINTGSRLVHSPEYSVRISIDGKLIETFRKKSFRRIFKIS